VRIVAQRGSCVLHSTVSRIATSSAQYSRHLWHYGMYLLDAHRTVPTFFTAALPHAHCFHTNYNLFTVMAELNHQVVIDDSLGGVTTTLTLKCVLGSARTCTHTHTLCPLFNYQVVCNCLLVQYKHMHTLSITCMCMYANAVLHKRARASALATDALCVAVCIPEYPVCLHAHLHMQTCAWLHDLHAIDINI